MGDRTTEHLGDCCIDYEVESPSEYRARTGQYLGGSEPPLVGRVNFYIGGALAGTFDARGEARDHMKALACVATAYPIYRA